MRKYWSKGVVYWQAGNFLYVSVPFTWLVNDAISLIKQTKKTSFVGGPGAVLMKDAFQEIATVKDSCKPFDPISYHNPFATFTTRGCVRKCPFCAVPKIEGKFREIKDFLLRPLICDNNFLASSKKHFNRVIDGLKKFPYVDFNQGLEARRFTDKVARRMGGLRHVKLRFSFDRKSDEKYVVDAVGRARKNGLNDISCYLLFGFDDTPSDALYRAELLRKLKVEIFPMRYEPLDSMCKGEFVLEEKGWTDYELKRFKRYWRGNTYFKGPFHEFDYRKERGFGLGLVPSLKKSREGIWED